jgi:hypothetical protein
VLAITAPSAPSSSLSTKRYEVDHELCFLLSVHEPLWWRMVRAAGQSQLRAGHESDLTPDRSWARAVDCASRCSQRGPRLFAKRMNVREFFITFLSPASSSIAQRKAVAAQLSTMALASLSSCRRIGGKRIAVPKVCTCDGLKLSSC